MTTKHTPGPWKVSGTDFVTSGNASEAVADCQMGRNRPQDAANAAHIVRCVNMHDELRDALRGLFEHCAMVQKYWGDGSNQREADAAIAAARAALESAEGRENNPNERG